MHMQLKPITAIIVVSLFVASLSVTGCTSTSSTVSTDYPTSGRSKLIEGAIEQVRPSDSSSGDWKTQDVNVMWMGDTEATVYIKDVNTKSFDVLIREFTFTHWPSTDAATEYFYKKKDYDFSTSWGVSPPIDYYKLTGKVPTVVHYNRDSWGSNGIAQYDAFVVEKTTRTTLV